MSTDQKKALKAARRRTDAAALAMRIRDDYIRRALELASVREVASAVGLSPARVHQIRHAVRG